MSPAVRVQTPVSSWRVAAELTDSEATLRVALAAGGLTLLGVVLLVFTVWWWRSTRPERPVLGPLAMMGERSFRRVDASGRTSLLDAARPARGQGEPARSDVAPFDEEAPAERFAPPTAEKVQDATRLGAPDD